MKSSLTFYLSTLLCMGFNPIMSQSFLADMPDYVSNNAVVAVIESDMQAIYSFAGIGPGKTYNDIHSKCFKYDIAENRWTSLGQLPNGSGRIAASASYVNGKIYIIGGYEVFANGNERSIDLVHVYDPVGDTFMMDAPSLPIPIDDHVQLTYKDSLIYVITGWSNNGNVDNVQIFDTYLQTWSTGTPVPNSSAYKVFGASGCILGDDIYYVGGASALRNFPATDYIRKGEIDPLDPSIISWSIMQDSHAVAYRAAVSTYKGQLIMFGGSKETYNYDGISYKDGRGVVPQNIIKTFDPDDGKWRIHKGLMPSVMDLRGIAKLNENQYVIAGGMMPPQRVSEHTILIDLTSVFTNQISEDDLLVYPNPTSESVKLDINGQWHVRLLDIEGKELDSWKHSDQSTFSVGRLPVGSFLISMSSSQGAITKKIIIQ